jgi:hypothetical protein
MKVPHIVGNEITIARPMLDVYAELEHAAAEKDVTLGVTALRGGGLAVVCIRNMTCIWPAALRRTKCVVNNVRGLGFERLAVQACITVLSRDAPLNINSVRVRAAKEGRRLGRKFNVMKIDEHKVLVTRVK